MPVRIQRKRTKGYKMPEGAVYVGRPTKWGNPFYHVQRFVSLDASLRCYAMAVKGYWDPSEISDVPDGPFQIAHRDWQEFGRRFKSGFGPAEEIKEALRGKDLACWCPLDQPCHADVLLEIANAL